MLVVQVISFLAPTECFYLASLAEIQKTAVLNVLESTIFQYCPAGKRIFGLAARIEKQQGGGDDSAMNGVTIYCR